MSCSSRLRKLLLPLLKAVKEGRPISFRMRSAASQGLFLIGKGTSKQRGPSARLKRSSEKRKSHAEETAKIREAVRARSGGVCEGCGKRWGFWLWTMDHFDGGTGKSQRQSVENCWALCGSPSIPDSCHYLRQRNLPRVSEWNYRFAIHAAKHGYPMIEHIVHEPIARKAAP